MAKPNLAGARFRPPTTSLAGAFGPNKDAQNMATALVASDPAQAVPSAPQPLTPSVSLASTGSVVLPLERIRESEFNARVFYSTEEVDEMSASLVKNGQEVAAVGYWSGENVVLIDGQKRLRGAKSAGLQSLRIDIVEAPSNDRDIYLSSWRINKERSTQTPLDDSIRFKMLLVEAIFESQDQLAESLGMSKSGVSKVLALNAIPERVMRRLKDTNIPGSIKALYAISKLFPENIDTNPDALEKAETMAFDIIEDAVKKELSGNQVEALVEAKQKGPAVRVRNEVRHVAHGALKGTIKFNQEKGRLDFNVTGLSAERVTELREKVEAWCKEGIGE